MYLFGASSFLRREIENQTQNSDEPSQAELSGEVLNLLKIARSATGLSLDFWADFLDGFATGSVALLVMRAEMISAEMHRRESRDAQLGRFVREICSELEAPKLQGSVVSGGGLTVGEVLQAFEVVNPRGSGSSRDCDVSALWPALGDADRRIVSEVVRRLAVQEGVPT